MWIVLFVLFYFCDTIYIELVFLLLSVYFKFGPKNSRDYKYTPSVLKYKMF
jgi:hypothetical protein